MNSITKVSKAAGFVWAVVLGLALTLALLWALPQSGAEARDDADRELASLSFVPQDPGRAPVGVRDQRAVRRAAADARRQLSSPETAEVLVRRDPLPAEPHVRLEKNPDYYDAGSVVITQATSFLVGQYEAWDLYQGGEFDSIAAPLSAIGEITAGSPYSSQAHLYASGCIYYYGFSFDVPPFDDPLVRAAFASAIDRQQVIDDALGGGGLPALTLTPPGEFGHVDGYAAGVGRPFSPTMALELFAHSSYTYATLPEITLMFNEGVLTHQAVAESVRQMWIDNLGITVTLESREWGSYLDLLRDGSPEERPGVWRMAWCADYPDAHNWHHDALQGWPLADNPAYDAVVDAAALETVTTARLALYEQAERYLVMTDTALIPLLYNVQLDLTRPDVERTYPPFGGQHLDQWNITTKGPMRPLELFWPIPGSFDPSAVDWTAANQNYAEQLFLGLTDITQDGEVVPELATGWEASADLTVYTFTLRGDVKWTDGETVTAYDVESGVLRSLDPATGSGYAFVLAIIENAQDYLDGNITDPDQVGVEALDDTHIRFDLREPAVYFPAIAGLPPARPIPEWAIKEHGDKWTDPGNIVTNGPYLLTSVLFAPHLSIVKEYEWYNPPAEGDHAKFRIRYMNQGGGDAQNVVITDTMEGMEYVTDNAPFTRTVISSSQVVWDLGTVSGHEEGEFELFVRITGVESDSITNTVFIATSNPHDEGESGEKVTQWRGHVGGPAGKPTLVLEKNPDYYDAATVDITQTTAFLVSRDEGWDRYQVGEYDSVSAPGRAVAEIDDTSPFSQQLTVYPNGCTYYYGFSFNVPPFEDPNVRAAFSAAIDREALIAETSGGAGLPALTLTPPGQFGHVDGYAAGVGHPFSPTLALDLFASSSYTYATLPPITLMVNEADLHGHIAKVVQQMWKENLGIEVEVESLPWPDYLALINNPAAPDRPGVWRMGWCADYPDADTWHGLDQMMGQYQNRTGWDNPAYNELVTLAVTETVAADRLALYQQAEAYLVMTDTAMLPLYYYGEQDVVRPDVDRSYRPFGGQHLDEWDVTTKGPMRPLEIVWDAPDALDPAYAGGSFLNALFLGLTDYDEQGEVIPELATGWAHSADLTVYTFTLRSDVRWTDGTTVTAQHVEYGVLRSLDPATGSGLAYMLYVIKNAQDYNQGTVTNPALVGVEALDDSTLRFELERPSAIFPVIVAQPPAWAQPEWVITARSGGDWTDPANIVTNGPYRLIAWTKASHLWIEKEALANPGEGGNLGFRIRYGNRGVGDAENVVITDTMEGLSYFMDESPFPLSGGGSQVAWDLGTVFAGEEGEFYLVVEVTAVASETIRNRVDIVTTTPFDQGDPGEKTFEWEGHVTGNNTWLNVGKDSWVGDPAAGYPLVFNVDVNNHCDWGATAASQVTLIDTLHPSMTLQSWWSDQPDYWTEVSSSAHQLVLEAPTMPECWGSRVYIKALVDPAAWYDMRITNTATVNSSNNQNPDSYTEWDAWLRDPYTDLRVDKSVFPWFSTLLVPGGKIDYNIDIRNQGNVPLVGTVRVTDTLPVSVTFRESIAWQNDADGFGPFLPVEVTDEYVVWEVGPLEAGEGGGFLCLVDIDPGADPNRPLTNTVEIQPLPGDTDLGNNAAVHLQQIFDHGPNLQALKWHKWDGDWRLNYEVYVLNAGDETIYNVVVTDTYPASTTFNGEWGTDYENVGFAHNQPQRQLVWQIDEIRGGDYYYAWFNVDLDNPGEQYRFFTNTLQAGPLAGDVNPADNDYTDVASSGGEVDRLGIDVYGTHIWGDVPNGPITVTAPTTWTVLPWGGHFDWDAPDTIVPGDTIIVAAGAGTRPVVATVPDPFYVTADSDTDTVWGQIDHLDHEWVDVQLDSGPRRWVQTDGDGNFNATFSDVPRGATGRVRWYAQIDFAQVQFDRRFQTNDLVFNANYGNDWVEGNYEPGHTVWITVTESDGVTPKGTAQLTTGFVPWWSGQSGFSTNWQGWTWQPDMQPGNWVYGRVDNGKTNTLLLGEISGNLSAPADEISGTILAPWVGEEVKVDCHTWGAPGWAPNKQDWIVPNGVEVYTCAWDPGTEWDVDYEQDVAVSYREPDGDQVYNVFRDSLPDLQVNKWNTQGHARPGGMVVYGLSYRNNGGATAENVTIVDTLPADVSYLDDTGGFPVDVGAGGVITWHLGSVDPNQDGAFMVTLQVGSVPTGGGQIAENCAAIDTTTPFDPDPGNNAICSGRFDVWETDVEIGVSKWCDPQDPTPGQQYQCTVQWCNNRGAAAGPVWLTDTLPAYTTLLNWYPDDWVERYWTEVSSGGQLVLYAPGLPGNACQNLHLDLLLESTTPISTDLVNSAVIAVADDVYPDNNQQAVTLHAGLPRYDLYLDKSVHRSVPVPGGWVNYFVWYQNRGNSETRVWVTDTIPAGLTYESAHWGGGQPQENDPFPPVTVIGGQLVWDLGTLPVNGSAWFHIQTNVTDTLSAGYVFTNCAVIGRDGPEDTPGDNSECVAAILNPNGPNLFVWKQYWWNSEGQLQYQIYFANLGDQTINNVWITDTLPLGTHWNNWWDWDSFDWNRFVTLNHTGDRLAWNFDQLDPGDYGQLRFQVDLDSPGERVRWYTNTVEITTPPGDVDPGDNSYTTVAFSGGEVDRVQIWYDPANENTNVWGDAQPGAVVTVTAPHGLFTAWADPDCGGCWGVGSVGAVLPGEFIVVTAGAGLLPVTIQVPDPFTAAADSGTDTVSGQIGGWLERTVEIHGDWDYQEVQTDNAGNFLAPFGDVPRGGTGYIRWVDSVDYAEVIWHQPFWTPDLVLQVNYGHDWVEGTYEPGHTVWITVTESDGATVKGTAVLPTGYVPWWNGRAGFSTRWPGWVGDQPDIQPGDWVLAASDTGATADVQLGAVTGNVDSAFDSIAGTVDAAWIIGREVQVQCVTWGAPGGAPDKDDFVWPDGLDVYTCAWDPLTEWDVQPMQLIGVFYLEPDGDAVGDVFMEYNLTIGVNYAHDWINGDTKPGEIVEIVVADSGGAVKGTFQVTAGCQDGNTHFNTSDGNCWNGGTPDIVPGDRVTVTVASLELVATVNPVGEITGALDLGGDTVSGNIYANWFTDPLHVFLWVDGGPGRDFWVDPDGGGFSWDLAADGWDLQTFQQVWVQYHEPDGDAVTNVFAEYDLHIGVNYGHDWVDGATQPGAVVDIVVADSGGAVKGTFQMTAGCGGNGTDFRTYDNNCWNGGAPDIVPGDRVTVTAASLGLVATVNPVGEITAALDLDADTVSGAIHAGWFTEPLRVMAVVSGGPQGREFWVDPDGGTFVYNLAADGWDLQAFQQVWVHYQEPDGDWVMNVFQEYGLPIGVNYAHDWVEGDTQPGALVDIVIADSGGTVKGTFQVTAGCKGGTTFNTGDGNCWNGYRPDIVPGDRVTVTAASLGLVATVNPVGEITAALDLGGDTFSGNLYANWFAGPLYLNAWVDGGPSHDFWVDPDGGGFFWDLAADGWDLQPFQQVYVRYQEPDGDWVWNVLVEYGLRIGVNYAHDWVNGDSEPGAVVDIVIADSGGAVKGTYQVTAGCQDGKTHFNTGDGNCWNGDRPDIVPGDRVTVTAASLGLVATVNPVGEITGALDLGADTVSGNLYANWFAGPLYINAWVDGGPGHDFWVDPDGGGFFWDLAADGWDLQPFQQVYVQYQEPDGDWVWNVFQEYGLRIGVNYAHDWVNGDTKPGEVVDIVVADGGGAVKGTYQVTAGCQDGNTHFNTGDGNCWNGDRPDIVPGDRVTVTAASLGLVATVNPVGEIAAALDLGNDTVSGHLYANWFAGPLYVWASVEGGPGRDFWVDPDGGGFVWDVAADGWDLQAFQPVWVQYQEPDGDWVYNLLIEYGLLIGVNYAHDWVNGDSEPGALVDIVIADNSGTIKGTFQVTAGCQDGNTSFNTGDGNCWNGDRPDIVPGDRVTVTAASLGLVATVNPVGEITGALDLGGDTFSGNLYANWFAGPLYVNAWVDGGPSRDFWVDPNGGSIDWNLGADGWDLQPFQQVYVRYQEPDGDWVWNVFEEYNLHGVSVNYADDWINGNTQPGAEVEVVLADNAGAVKQTFSLTAGCSDGYAHFNTRHGNCWNGDHPDIVPGDRVTVTVPSLGFQATINPVGTITGVLDVVADTIGGNIYADWLPNPIGVSCGIANDWGNTLQWYTVDPAGGRYDCDFTGIYDILPGDWVGVQYQEPDGDFVMNMFQEPAPYLRLRKYSEGSEPGGGSNYLFRLGYWNEGTADAENVVITDTMEGMIYLEDTSGLAHTGTGAPGDPVVWQVGTVPAGSGGDFYYFVAVTAVESDTITNTARIATSTPYDQGDLWEKEEGWSGHVQGSDVQVNVSKDAFTGDPAPDTTFVYRVNVCNHGNTASAQVLMTDTLPAATTLDTWWGQHAGWSEVYNDGRTLVVSYPSIPGYGWCSHVYLRAHVDAGASPGTDVSNTAVVACSNDLNLDDNENTWGGSVGQPHLNLAVWKDWWWGQLTAGGRLWYEFEHGNNGNLPVDDVWMTATLPVSVTLVRFDRFDQDGNYQGQVAYIQTGDALVWNVGTIPNGEQGRYQLVVDIDRGASPGTLLVATIRISEKPGEDTYDDNLIQWVNAVNPEGPNLAVNKQNWNWRDNDERLSYELRIKNLGTERLENIWITDTYPISTTFNGDFHFNHGPWITWTDSVGDRQLYIWLEGLNPGETASVDYRVDLDPSLWGVRERYYTNTVEAPWPGDVYPGDNQDTAVAYSGPQVQLFVRVNQSHNWAQGEAPRHAQVVVTVWRDGVPVMTESQWTGDGTGWNINFCCGWERRLLVGDLVEVQTSDGQSALVEIIPMQGEVDSNANTISGQLFGVSFPAAVRAEVWGRAGGAWVEGTTSITGSYALDFSPFDLLPGHMVGLWYVRPDGHEVAIVRHGLQLRVDVGVDSVGGETVPGVPVTVTVNSGETHTTMSSEEGSFDLEFEADITAGDLVEGWAGWGTQYTTLVVADVTAYPDDANDRVWGNGPPNDQVNVGPNGDWRWTATDGSGFFEEYYGWDINPDTDVEVEYEYPEGHTVRYRFGPNDVRVDKWSDIWRPVPGDVFSFTIRYGNNGNGPATGVILTDTLPVSLTYLSDTSDLCQETPAGSGVVVCDIGTLASYRERTFAIQVQLDPSADPNWWSYENVVRIAADNDRYPDNNEGRAGINTDYPRVDLWVDKWLQAGLPLPGEVITYRISYGNGGNRPAVGILLTDTLPADTTFVGTTFEGPFAVAAGQVLFDLGTVPAGQSGEFELGVRIDPGVAEGALLVNTLAIGSTPPDPSDELRDNWRQYTVAVEPAAADLWVSKEVWGDFSSIDNEFVYHITFGNSGNTAAHDVVLTDTLPASIIHLWHSAGSAATVSGEVIAWHLGTVPAGATGELLIGVRVDTPVPAGTSFFNTVVVFTSTPEQDYENNQVEDELGPPRVIAVPWAGDRPHRVWSGLDTTLKGTAKGYGLGQFEWDPGDGTAPIVGWVGDPYVIEADHTYYGAVGDVYTATLTIWGAYGWSDSDTYVVQVYSQTQGVEVDVAVDEGLWYVHKSANRYPIAGYPAADWSCCGNPVAEIVAAVQSFQVHGHLPGGDPMEDPYVEDVRRGWNTLFSYAVLDAMSVEPRGDPDINGDGAGVGVYSNYGHSIYESGLALMALASTGTPDQVARTGPPVYVRGRTYRDIAQNMADWFAWGQNDYGWARGGWRYQPNSGDSDNSNTQFPVLGLAAAEETWGIAVPGWVKDELRDYWLPSTQNPNGGFGYTDPNNMVNVGKTGAGIMDLFWAGLPVTDTRIVSAVNYVYTHWYDPLDPNGNSGGNVGDLYAMYAVKKGSQLAQIDFYGPLTDTIFWQTQYDAYLVGAQQPDGRWDEDPSLGQWIGGGQPQATAWGLLILAPGIYEALPVAIIAPVHQGWEGQPVQFDGSLSHHTDPHRMIVWYQWDFDDGSPVISTTIPIVTHTYAARGLYRATLTVWDDAGKSASRATLVMITAPNNPPVADPNGPYLGRTGETLFLDGSGSYDPDAGLGDHVTQYVWDIQGGSLHTTTQATLPYSWTLAGTYQVTLTVRDRGADYGLDSPKWSDPVVTIAVIQEPVAGLTAVNDSPTVLGNATTLVASVTAGSDLEWIWDLGDGTTGSSLGGTIVNVPHVYPQIGVYTAVFTVSNDVSFLSAATVVAVIDEEITGLTASNDGPTPLSRLTTLSAAVASGTNVVYTWDLGDWTFTAGQVVGHVYPAVGTYTAVVTASNSLSQMTAQTVVVIERTADLSVTKLDGPDPVIIGHPLTYTLEVVNNGPFQATGVVLVDTLPEDVTYDSDTGGCALAGRTLTCALANLVPGGNTVIEVTVTPTAIGTLINYAEVTGVEHDLDLTDNLAGQETTVTPENAPVASRITPNSGYNDGVTPVIIEGGNFVEPVTVTLNSTPLLSVTLLSRTVLTAAVPSGMAPQTYDLEVSTEWGSYTLLGAFTVLQPTPPVVSSVVPGSGRNDLPATIDIYGANFAGGAADGATAELNTGGGRSVAADPVEVEGLLFVDSTHLRGMVPQGILTGTYTLTVTNPDRYSGSLANAYQAFEVYDDLYASPGDLWLTPPTYHQGDPAPTIGVRVRRQGGIGGLTNVVVAFYRGNPAAGGTLLGTGNVALLPPNSAAVTTLTWQPRPSAGSYTLYAVIDYGNGVPEANEGNNTINLGVTVRPPRPDTTPPTVQSFIINGGAASTSNRQVVLDTVAIDNVGGSGIYQLHFVEFEWVQSVGDWVLVAQTGWLPYNVVKTGYLWLLQPEAGVRYLQVWASDKSGNVSLLPGEAFINYVPKTAYVALGQVHIYRQTLAAGQSLRVRLTSITGDADLYVWDPAGGLVAYSWAYNPEDVTFVAGMSGVYQIEVEGWTAAYYKLEIIPLGGGPRAPLAPDAVLRPDRGRGWPYVMPGNTPSQDVGLPTAPEEALNQYVEGLVFLDVNGDGVYTMGSDRPLAGAEVLITDTVDYTLTVIADANGTYSMTVPPGETTVDVLEASLPANVVLAVGSEDPKTVNVPEDEHAQVTTGYVYDQYVDGMVFLDVDADGAYLAGTDTLLDGVDVAITDSDGLVYQHTTDANGAFMQTVPAGDTQVDVDQADVPANVVLTVGSTDPTTVTVPAGGHATDGTGYVYNQYVEGTVFVDVDGDGDYTAGTDTPLDGVDVTITDANQLAYIVTTDADGYFMQTVPAGDTQVDVDNADLPANVSLATGSTDPSTVPVPADGHATDDTGYVYNQYVDGIVYLDVNADGAYTAGTDRLLDGVDVAITDVDALAYTVTTDANGYFSQTVPAGNTQVDVDNADLPANVVLATGSTDPSTVLVPAGGHESDDTGYVYNQYVEGIVFLDLNTDSHYDVGTDTPLVGVDMFITDSDQLPYTVTTDAGGYYKQTVPAGWTLVDVDNADLPPNVALLVGYDPESVQVPAGGHYTVMTGYFYGQYVDGTVYLDVDGDGVLTEGIDRRLGDVDVTITDVHGVAYTVQTGASGYFRQNVPVGTTTVDVDDADLPANVVPTTGSTDPTVVTAPAGGHATDNTGFVYNQYVDGTVYKDVNRNGSYDPGIDEPLPGVNVLIHDVDSLLYTLTTDANGYFKQPVPAGSTTVDVDDADLPQGAKLTTGSTDPTTDTVPVGDHWTDDTGYTVGFKIYLPIIRR